MEFELGFEKNNFLGNGIRTPPPPPLHDPLTIPLEYYTTDLRQSTGLSQSCYFEARDVIFSWLGLAALLDYKKACSQVAVERFFVRQQNDLIPGDDVVKWVNFGKSRVLINYLVKPAARVNETRS